jgi:acyl-CoA thioester hydrolase
MTHFNWPIRVYYEDTDAGGVVYYANYLKFMERARTEWLRALGVEQDQLREEAGLLLMVHSLSVHYRKPAKFNEALQVSVNIKHLGKAKIMFTQQVLRQNDVLCECEVTIACVDEVSGRPSAFGQQLQQAFEGVLR